MFSDHSIAPISAPDTCSPAPAIVIQIGRLSPARPDQQIQSFINIDLYINSARDHSREPVQSTSTNLYWIYTPSILWDTQIPAIQSNSARIVAHTWRAWQISCGLRAAASSLSTPVTSFVTWIGHPCAPNNASPALSPETLEKCSADWI